MTIKSFILAKANCDLNFNQRKTLNSILKYRRKQAKNARLKYEKTKNKEIQNFWRIPKSLNNKTKK